ncbi:MAG: glyoxalase [Sphingomonas sp. SCN 67-18]|uniref:VOC family protein n=1 Tax=uncultured Sphingomonas sp. TaxID=158754 RepID=UPI00086ECC4A|nr:VOC family protein [Sphingomonas sp. SCN 67-18]ODU21823.1 MAG: glyoxalase [Sphingomonas sp. SCN 67-18]
MGVTGIGGLFFRARDPQALSAWYVAHLGIGPGCSATGAASDPWSWQTAGGTTVFAPFPQDSDYFPADRQWMLNLRVDDLDTLLAKLSAAGVAIVTKPEWDTPETGRFARIHDPEGNPVELWEPPAD